MINKLALLLITVFVIVIFVKIVKSYNYSSKIENLQKLSWNNFEHTSKNSSEKLDDYRNRILFNHFVNN